MTARRRHRKPARRDPFRDTLPVVLIVCEGKVTEPQYFEGLKRAARNPRVTIRISPQHGVPKTLVEVAKQWKDVAEKEAKREGDDNLRIDSVWCVFDVDEHPGIPEAQQTACDDGIELAVSNPCFELWLLLHFRDSPGMQDRDHIRQLLKHDVPEYDKHVEFSTYSSGYSQAVTRAERLDRMADEVRDPGCNPTTGVYRLATLVFPVAS